MNLEHLRELINAPAGCGCVHDGPPCLEEDVLEFKCTLAPGHDGSHRACGAEPDAHPLAVFDHEGSSYRDPRLRELYEDITGEEAGKLDPPCHGHSCGGADESTVRILVLFAVLATMAAAAAVFFLA